MVGSKGSIDNLYYIVLFGDLIFSMSDELILFLERLRQQNMNKHLSLFSSKEFKRGSLVIFLFGVLSLLFIILVYLKIIICSDGLVLFVLLILFTPYIQQLHIQNSKYIAKL